MDGGRPRDGAPKPDRLLGVNTPAEALPAYAARGETTATPVNPFVRGAHTCVRVRNTRSSRK